MKNLFITTLLFVLTSIEMLGQSYETHIPKKMIELYSMEVYCCAIYDMGVDGFYSCETYDNPISMEESTYIRTSMGVERFFCYLEEENRFYFHTDNFIGYYIPTNTSCSKFLKKSLKKNNVRKVIMEEVQSVMSDIIKKMDDIYLVKNDSITDAKKIERERVLKDSIEVAKKKAQEMDEYRRTHEWRKLVNNKYGLWCATCSKIHNDKNLTVVSINSDTLYYLISKPDITLMGNTYHKIHYSRLSKLFDNDVKLKEYVNMWRDSIANNNTLDNLDAEIINVNNFNKFKDSVCEVAPNGFIDSWGWKLNSADGVEPRFTYFNTSKKTIKYIDLYFSVYNAVGDRCLLKYDNTYVSSIRGVGPVEPFDYGSWEWDRATHYTSGDASKMQILKLVITYMDGTSKTIPEKAIIYNAPSF